MPRTNTCCALAACALLATLGAFAALANAAEPSWEPIGPPGGDVRKLASDPRDPRIVYLGAATGVLYRSQDGGLHWQRLSLGFSLAGMSLDDILIAPDGAILLGFWQVGGPGGGVARSDDGGHTFRLLAGLTGESVRGLAVAKSDPRLLVAVTLTGVFRSEDSGETWRRISPEGHPGLRNFGSVAVDPIDPGVVYAGTWHLPWKTSDGGRTWRLAQAGMIVDSDVMTLSFDRRSPSAVFATACSGIYRSSNAAGLWTKVRGIPSSARRTRAFLQHPRRPEVFFAGTTEGLWMSEDDMQSWRRLTGPDVVVNTIEVLPDDAILLGCDGLGVLRSTDRGLSWTMANDGLYERSVLCAAFQASLGRLLVGVAGRGHEGGVWAATWPDRAWKRLGEGLEGREVLALAENERGVLAGTDDGVFSNDSRNGAWRRLTTVTSGVDAHPRVVDLLSLSQGEVIVLATPQGLMRSADGGTSWTSQPLGESQAVLALCRSSRAGALYAATPLAFFESLDQGAHWATIAAAPADGLVRRMAASSGEDGTLYAGTSRGLLKSGDAGRTWRLRGGGLPQADVPTLAVQGDGRTIFVGDHTYGGVYRSDDLAETFRRLPVEGLHSAAIFATALDPTTQALVAGGATGGLFRFVPPETAGGALPAAQ